MASASSTTTVKFKGRVQIRSGSDVQTCPASGEYRERPGFVESHCVWVRPMVSSSREQTLPLVVSVFIKLDHKLVKHPYNFQHSANVPAPYLIFGTPTDVENIVKIRQAQGHTTEVQPLTMRELVIGLAAWLKRDPEVLERAARHSQLASQQWQVRQPGYQRADRLHCPSSEIILIWLAKLHLMSRAMDLHPERTRFAYVDVGFNIYRASRAKPPPAPWTLFWPRNGIAALLHEGACHNALRGANHSTCVVGTFLFGDRAAWQRLSRNFGARTARLVDQAAAISRPAGAREAWPVEAAVLCADQDVLTDVARDEPTLFEWFVTDGGGYGWGWGGARPARTAAN